MSSRGRQRRDRGPIDSPAVEGGDNGKPGLPKQGAGPIWGA